MANEKTHFSLTWDKYHSSMCAGFSLLQQNGELVDLTIAADGHLIKVHQMVLGVASPYIKELIQSADCKHPVIFMNNISYTVLRSLLEYIYTGEVSVEEDNLGSFFETAKALKIKGLECMQSVPKDGGLVNSEEKVSSEIVMIENDQKLREDDKKPSWMVPSQIASRKRKSIFTQSAYGDKKSVSSSDNECLSEDMGQDKIEDDDLDEEGNNVLIPVDRTADIGTENTTSTTVADLQYTVSNRGSLQLILNRFMYNLHYSRSKAKHLRMWRCVDYQDHRCVATAVTDNNVVVKRTNLHNHPFHDKRILKKINKKAVFSAIRAVENKGVTKS